MLASAAVGIKPGIVLAFAALIAANDLVKRFEVLHVSDPLSLLGFRNTYHPLLALKLSAQAFFQFCEEFL